MTIKRDALSYNLKISVDHGYLLIKALDFYSRIFMGQLGEIEYLVRMEELHPVEGHKPDLEKVKSLCDELKAEIFGMPQNMSWGIRNTQVGVDAQRAYEIQQILRHRLAHDLYPLKPGQWGGVIYDTPMGITGNPMPELQKLDAPI